ncbi:deoxyribose-phosphate aldolase [Micrococcales bacterium 31B]|nr:deoxyribose-phosphate aldolase [Micrococcales bacterium 31B]
MTELTREQLAQYVDHTYLDPRATHTEVRRVIDEAAELGAYSVCVTPAMLPIDAKGLKVTAVVGFPSGMHTSTITAVEAAEAVAHGADEIDLVINLGKVIEGNLAGLVADVLAVRSVVPGVLKVIIESAALTDEQIKLACEACMKAGADFVKTSTGFHPSGGATVEAVRLIRETVGPEMGVKASGGIRTREAALAMIEAGATRLGLSGTRAVLDGAASTGSY